MSNEVVGELAPGDIQKPTAPQPTAPVRAPAPVTEAQPAAMSADQTAGVAAIDNLRREASDPALESGKRDALNRKIVELQRHVFNGAAKPSWYGEQKPDPRMADQRPHDAMRSTFERALQPMTGQESERLASHAAVIGLAPEAASFVAEVAKAAGFDFTSGKALADRAAHHAREGWGLGAELSEADRAELAQEFARTYGSVERATAEMALARAYIQHAGLEDYAEALGSLGWDPAIVGQFSYRARVLGLGKQ